MKQCFLLTIIISFLFIGVACSNDSLQSISTSSTVVASLNIYDQTISFINTDTKEKITWEISEPFKRGIFLSSDHLLLLNKDSEYAYIYELSTGKKKEWEIGKGIETALLSHTGEKVYFADQLNNKIKSFDLDGIFLNEISVDNTPLTLFENQRNLYISYLDEPSVSIISKESWKLTDTFSVHSGAVGGFISSNNELWLGGHGSGVNILEDVNIYNIENGKLIKSIYAPSMPVDFQTVDEKVYVLSHGSNILREIHSETYETVRTLEVGANPFSMIISHNEIYISSYDANEIEIIDLVSFTKKSTIPVGDGPLQLLVREGKENGEQ